jgi:integrase
MSKVGVDVREKSIRLRFTLDGLPLRPTLRDDDGHVMPPTPINIRYASRLANEIQQLLESGKFILSDYFPDSVRLDGILLADHLDTWFATLRLAPSTLAAYGSAMNFWKRALGDRVITELTVADVRTALASRKGLSGKTINNYTSVLRDALALALTDGLLQRNVVDDVSAAKWQRQPPDPFSKTEVAVILADMHGNVPGPVCDMVEFWFFTGLRTGELFGLRWKNVDLRAGTIVVSESTVMGEHQDTTKTGVARTVALNSRAAAALERQSMFKGLGDGCVWLMPGTVEPWTDERAFRCVYWEPALQRVGVRYRRPYNCRHTYATMMLMANATPAWCARQLGHSIQMFLGTYSKWIDGDQNSRELAGLETWLAAT